MALKEPRLKFTPEERASPELKKAVKKVDKAVTKADKAKAKIPQKAVKTRTIDPATGKVKTQLQFVEKKPPSKLMHSVSEKPAAIASTQVHKNIHKYEDDNVGVEASHKMEEGAEIAGHFALSEVHASKLRPYRKAAEAERKLEKANLKALYRTARAENTGTVSSAKWQQKRAIKKQYAAAKRAGQETVSASELTTEAAKNVKGITTRAVEAVRRNKKGLAIVGILALVVMLLLSVMSSCSILMEGVISAVGAVSFPSEDEDMLAAEAQYSAMEAELQEYLDTFEDTHDYDSYEYELDEIGHDPYVLVAALTALHGGAWTIDDVQDDLQMLFEKQYTLTEETDTDDEESTTCTVTLENFNLSHVPAYVMTEDQLTMYATYMRTLGNRTDLFPDADSVTRYAPGSYTDYEIPTEALADETFATMIAEAEKYLGYPYVFGGSSPSTSFDCSGFVCWVVNHSGWNVGRITAQGLYNYCTRTSTPHPGDLVFYQGTYNAGETVTHVGIYVGDGWMIHCGDPISYVNFAANSYWQSHFYAYGRLP